MTSQTPAQRRALCGWLESPEAAAILRDIKRPVHDHRFHLALDSIFLAGFDAANNPPTSSTEPFTS